MEYLFRYNWAVRDEWFEWCSHIPHEELVKKRLGGAGSILFTLFHIIDVEYSWIRAVQNKPDFAPSFDRYGTLEKVKSLSDELRPELHEFLEGWTGESDDESVKASWSEDIHTAGEILRHVIAHEIHHVGQLSIWAREIGKEPVSANFIGRGLM